MGFTLSCIFRPSGSGAVLHDPHTVLLGYSTVGHTGIVMPFSVGSLASGTSGMELDVLRGISG